LTKVPFLWPNLKGFFMKVLGLFSVLVFAASVAYAEVPPERLKTHALSFAFNGSSQVGGKIWISDLNALTLSVGAGTVSTTREAADTSDRDDKNTQSNFSVSLGMERHLDLGREFSPYLTGGVSLVYDDYTYSFGPISNPFEYKSRSTRVGVYAGLGLEYWLTHRLTISGQQTITGSYGVGEFVSDWVGTPTDDTRSYSVGLGTSSLIFSAYF